MFKTLTKAEKQLMQIFWKLRKGFLKDNKVSMEELEDLLQQIKSSKTTGK